ncbi:hypothetical protein G7Y89_g8549 [Cudoniella acicularis]|uniref:Uncharacterized protein n=1 Tax=Cudoniella acicularis TaxID=354080 RepID=A0A8H4RHY4_9HELO|nr:hypothetical protein G7Y89_g8549 [Cudoniella acicularis]
MDGPSNSFQPCSKLPRKLRIKIWEYTLEPSELKPHIVTIIYNEPTNSFSYSKSIFAHSRRPQAQDTSYYKGTRVIMPFIDSKIDINVVASVRFLLLDDKHWTHRFATNKRRPIKELQKFKNLEEIFFVGLSVGELTETQKASMIANNPQHNSEQKVYLKTLE